MDSIAPVPFIPVQPTPRDPGDGRRVPQPPVKFLKRAGPRPSEDEDFDPEESEPRQVDVTV